MSTRHALVLGFCLALIGASAEAQLTAPANFTAGAPAPEPTSGGWMVPFSWSPVAGALSYQIQWTASIIQPTSVETSGTNFTVRNLTSGVTYSFRLRVINRTPTFAMSPQTDPISLTYVVPTPTPIPNTLTAPTNFVATPVWELSAWAADLSWSPVSGAQSYRLAMSTDATFPQMGTSWANLTGTTYHWRGFPSGATRYFRVFVINQTPSYQQGPYSNVLTVTYTAPAAVPTPTPTPIPASVPTKATLCSSIAGNALSAGQRMTPGQWVTSPNRMYMFIYQTDGNLVLYRGAAAVWNAGKIQSPGTAVMQTDGNFVLYNNASAAYWNTVTAGKGGTLLSVQDDGNLVIYKPNSCTAVWASK